MVGVSKSCWGKRNSKWGRPELGTLDTTEGIMAIWRNVELNLERGRVEQIIDFYLGAVGGDSIDTLKMWLAFFMERGFIWEGREKPDAPEDT